MSTTTELALGDGGGSLGPPKVYWRKPDGSDNPDHDFHVRQLIGLGMERIEREGLTCGIGVIDFADCTVVVISKVIPHKEVFEMNRMMENSILDGRFGVNPFA